MYLFYKVESLLKLLITFLRQTNVFCRNDKMLNKSLLLNLEEVKVVACSIVSSLYTVKLSTTATLGTEESGRVPQRIFDMRVVIVFFFSSVRKNCEE